MAIQDLCRAYLEALNEGDLSKVLALFVADAEVSSPLYGVRPAADFYRDLFSDTNRSETRLKAVFEHSDGGASVALHFDYDWVFKSGQAVSFECVDIFEMTPDYQRFSHLKIIYDTAPFRSDFEQLSVE
nr:nuclear transport factor 2 family protein [uncultured Neokomagataea sp.]